MYQYIFVNSKHTLILVFSGAADAEVSTFSHTVGSVTTQPHNCDLCHKQYASKAKLLQHMRKKHKDQAAPSTSTKGGRPAKVVYTFISFTGMK